MSDQYHIPTFNLGAVLQETGLKPDTLRAWERRYGLPQPQRSSGGHRLYSQHDIDTIKWLMARQAEGLSISKAVALWKRLEEEGRDPLLMPEYAAPQPPRGVIPPDVGEAIADLREGWLAACLYFDEAHADQILTQAFGLYAPEVVCTEVLLPALAAIGEGWYRGEITVQQEHFASALAERKLITLIATMPPPTQAAHVLVGAPPGEEHTIGLLALTFMLRRQGWRVTYLGANVPITQLSHALTAIAPDLVIMAAQRLPAGATLLQAAQFCQNKGVPLGFGGLIFNQLPALRERIPGHFLGARVNLAAQTTARLLTSLRPIPSAEPAPADHLAALAHFEGRRPLVEAEVWQATRTTEIAPAALTAANEVVASIITAALALGDITLVRNEIDWVEGLLGHRQVPMDLLHYYLDVYYHALRAQLSEPGEVIVNWFGQAVGADE
jgi:DNA-binding transcriptional MerR regulator